MAEPIAEAFVEHAQVVAGLHDRAVLDAIEEFARSVAECATGGRTVLACGNGGSAAQAQHFAAELVGRFSRERGPLSAVALCADSAIVTALANDYGYEEVFARQVEALGQPGDLLVAISTSGRSRNCVRAVEAARDCGIKSVALTGAPPHAIEADIRVCVPSRSTARVQEAHALILHAACARVDQAIEELEIAV